MISASIWLAVLAEAKLEFGEPDTWSTYEVGAWMKRRLDALRDGKAAPRTVAPFQPRSFTEPVEPEVGRWDDVEDL